MKKSIDISETNGYYIFIRFKRTQQKRGEARMKMTLKALRVNADMTQKETAERLGISVSTLMFWEQGKRYPNVKDIQKIEKLFNVNYDDIIFLG